MAFIKIDDLKKEQKKYALVDTAFKNEGFLFDEDGNTPILDENGEQARARFLDFITEEDIKPLLTKVISTIVIEAIQPALLIVPNLCTIIRTDGSNQTIEVKSLQGINVGKIAKGGDWPKSNLAFDSVGNAVSSEVMKVGTKLLVDNEVIQKNQFNVVAIWLNAAGKALAQYKEKLAMDTLLDYGRVVFSNTNPNDSEYGITTGRDIAGQPNGTFTVENFQQMYAYLLLRGFNPDTLIINPLAWQVLALDPEFREIVLKGATLSYPVIPPNGSPAAGRPDIFNGLGVKSSGTGNAQVGISGWTTTLNPIGATFTLPAKYLPNPVKVLVSAYVPYNKYEVNLNTNPSGEPIWGTRYTTSIIMADSSKALILYQEQDPRSENGVNLENDVYFIRISETYGFGIWDQGKGFVIADDIVIDKNYVFQNSNDVTLSPIIPSNKVNQVPAI